jgi:hypothetical protein
VSSQTVPHIQRDRPHSGLGAVEADEPRSPAAARISLASPDQQQLSDGVQAPGARIGVSGGIAVRVVAELSQHTRPKHHAKPGQALDDPRVPMDGESEGELLLEGGDLHVEAAEHSDQGAPTTSR